MLLMINFKLCIFGKNTTEGMLCPSQSSYQKAHGVDFSITSDHLVKGVSPTFSSINSSIFPL